MFPGHYSSLQEGLTWTGLAMASGLIGNLFTDVAKDLVTKSIRRGATPIESRSQVLATARKAILEHFDAVVTWEPDKEEVAANGDWRMVFRHDDYLYCVRVRSLFLAPGGVAAEVVRERRIPDEDNPGH